MLRQVAHWVKRFSKVEEGVTSLEYCCLWGGISFVIIFGGSILTPEISRLLGDTFNPHFVSSEAPGCVAHHSGEDGNCGVGLGLGSNNGTPNEGEGQGPGPDHEQMDNPAHGNP